MNAEGEDGSLGEYALWNVGDITDSDGNFVRQFRDVKFSSSPSALFCLGVYAHTGTNRSRSCLR